MVRGLNFFAYPLLAACLSCTCLAQQAVELPGAPRATKAAAQRFRFVSDGPAGPGWSRPDEIARTYFHEQLPAFFSRTITLDEPIPESAHLDWIFTGPHAGFTVELSSTKVRVFERYYDSFGLYAGEGNYPDKIVRDEERQFAGEARALTVVLDAHLAVQVLVNGIPLLTQSCIFDVTRHQLMLAAPRTRHMVVSGSLLSESSIAATVTVHASEKHQSILGFGGSPSIPTYESLSEAGKEQYWRIVKSYNLLIDREYPTSSELKPDLTNFTDLNDATPHYYGDNFPNGEVSSFDYNRRILALGGSVLYELWALPSWATVAYSSSGPAIIDAWNKPVRRAADAEKYASIVVAYCLRAKKEAGAAPLIVGIENEVEQPPEVFAAMTTTLRQRLDAAGLESTRIQMADASFLYLGIERVKVLKMHLAAWKATDYVAAHQYDYQQFLANPDLYDARLHAMHDAAGGKPFLATEICLNDPHYQEASYRLAFALGQLYHKDLTELDAEALFYCWTLLDVEQPSFGASRSLLVPDRTEGNLPVASSFQLRVFGAFSRHLRKGMVRVSTESSGSGLLSSAYTNGKDATMILLNRSTAPQRVSIVWPGTRWSEVERTSLYEANGTQSDTANQMQPYSDTTVLVQPGEIVTLSTLHVA